MGEWCGEAGADGLGEEIAQGVIAGFEFGDGSGAKEVAGLGVIVAELGELAAAVKVDAAVADVGEVGGCSLDPGGAEGAGHSVALGVDFYICEDIGVGLVEGIF